MSRTILVVDDDEPLRSRIREQLSGAGYEMTEASNGWAALDYLWQADAPPHLILLDLRMPIMDGWQFRQLQMQDPDLCDIPVVLLLDAADQGRSTVALRALDTITKPIDSEHLINVIDHICAQARAR